MGIKILLAVDESDDSLRAIRYVAEKVPSGARVTLLSILPDPAAACELEGPSLVPLFLENRETFCALEEAKRTRVEAFLTGGREGLIRAGFAPENVDVRIVKKKKDIARDIVEEARGGKYDTIVMGRRGLTGVKEFLLGSVSNKVLHLGTGLAVTVVD